MYCMERSHLNVVLCMDSRRIAGLVPFISVILPPLSQHVVKASAD